MSSIYLPAPRGLSLYPFRSGLGDDRLRIRVTRFC